MIKTKYWLSILAISVVLIAGSLAVSPIAIADDDDDDDDDDKIVITGTPGDDVIFILDFADSISCNCAGITVTGPVTGPFTNFIGFERWIINSGVGNGFDTKYEINGNGGIDHVDFADGPSPDNDKVEIENVDAVRIFDGDGDDKYKVKGISGDSVEYHDGPGKDKLDFKG